MSSPTIHDPSTGFHDIKGLPMFGEVDLWWILPVLVIIAVLLAFWKLSVLGQKGEPVSEPPPLSPKDAAFRAIGEVERKLGRTEIELREAGTRLSLAFRTYLEAALHFSATDRTVAEITTEAKAALSQSLPVLPRDFHQELLGDIVKVLKACEQLTFAKGVEESASASYRAFETAVGETREIVTTLALRLSQERDRTEGIVAQSLVGQQSKE